MGSCSKQSQLRLLAQSECEQCPVGVRAGKKEVNHYRSAIWSPDGTSIIVNSANNKIETSIVPPELLDEHESALQLEPYSAIEFPDAADAISCYPGYDLQDVTTTLVLSALNEHPISLNSALTGELVASYPLVNLNTEQYIKPQAMIFTADGAHFITGSQSLISIFDVSRPGNEPMASVKTGPRKSNASWSNPTLSLRGLVSALAIDSQYNVLAAGTLSRQVGLYDSAGSGECVATFSIDATDAEETIAGTGVTQLAWSQCGRYLYIAERKSNGLMVYDIRRSGQLLAWLCGRNALTNQRMAFSMGTDTSFGAYDVWAGGQDGKLRRWSNAHMREGSIQPAEALQVHQSMCLPLILLFIH